MATLFVFPATEMHGDHDAQLVAGDAAAPHEDFVGRVGLSFDDTAEEAAITDEVEMPDQYTGSGLTARLYLFTKSSTSDDARWDVFVEAKTPDTDTLDMETANSWAAANSGTKTCPSTAGNLCVLSVTLSNADSAAVGDSVRFGVRRDCDHADNDETGDWVLLSLTIEDDG